VYWLEIGYFDLSTEFIQELSGFTRCFEPIYPHSSIDISIITWVYCCTGILYQAIFAVWFGILLSGYYLVGRELSYGPVVLIYVSRFIFFKGFKQILPIGRFVTFIMYGGVDLVRFSKVDDGEGHLYAAV
jgi:hypothetical protein